MSEAQASRQQASARIFFLAVGTALAVHACDQAVDPETDGSGEQVFSVQLHVHGSFSEGMGSIDSHSFEGGEVNVDAIWWSDHDFRITSYEHLTRFGFEGWMVPLDQGEAWSIRLSRHADNYKGLAPSIRAPGSLAEFVEDPVREGKRSFHVRSMAKTPKFQRLTFALDTSRKLHRRPLAADLTARIAIFPVLAGADARPFLRVLLSEHAPREGLALSQYSLRYYLSNEAEQPLRTGTTFNIPLAYEPGRWNEYTLDLTGDALRGFPFTPAKDNSLYSFLVGVESRSGAEVDVYFDDLRFEHARAAEEMWEIQGALIEEVAELHPGIVQLQGVEISYASRHLNEFSVNTGLLDYEAIAAACPPDENTAGFLDWVAFRQTVMSRAVEEAHARNGLISYNHLFGTSLEGATQRRTREEQLKLLLDNRAFGADLLEVGYRDRGGADLQEFLWVWDQMAINGLRLVGIGTSDSHGGPDERWRGRPDNFVSWIYARTLTKAALIEGLRAGRVFFGDLELFDGTLDLVTPEGWRMGQEATVGRGRYDVEIRVTGTSGGEELIVIERGKAVARHRIEGDRALIQHEVRVGNEDTFVRVELYDRDGTALAFSNPIHFLRSEAR